MTQLLAGWKRTGYCAEILKEEVGKTVTLMGWCDRRSDHGGLIFIDLRDRTGIMQVVFNESICSKEIFELASSIRNEFVLAVRGTIVQRSDETINEKLKTGYIEVRVEEFKILSKSEVIPFPIDKDTKVSENLRLKYRYLDLRRSEMQNNLKLRHRVAKICRDFYDENGFLEIETPTLCKSTPEGARDYLVPSRVHEGEFYALPQSPQIYKQLLMLSGFDKYFQIARCYRDEDLRADRQPEFTQIDVEMSFVDQEDVISINEKFISRVYKEVLNIDVALPLPRMDYAEAMDRFGSDKPDTRFGLELVDVSQIAKTIDFGVFTSAINGGGSVRAINATQSVDKLARREIDALVEYVKQYGAKGMAWISITADGTLKSAITKFMTPEQTKQIIDLCNGKPNDTIFFVADTNNDVVFAALGALRLELGKKFDLIDPKLNNWLWVTDFPLFEYDAKENRYVAKHHPFTSPKDEDLEKLETDPGSVRAKAYDIILNGNEIGGGSIRIHSSQLQEKMFEKLGFSKQEAADQFGFLINAFKYGPPPHGGLALGLDRLVMLMCNTASIRDVIAFPKIQNASCPLTDAPSVVDEKQLQELHIKVAKIAKKE